VTHIISSKCQKEPESVFSVQAGRNPDGKTACFIGSDVYRSAAFGKHHPLSIIRVSGVADLCAMLGWLDDGLYRDSPRASEGQLTRFHDPDYVSALRRADELGRVDRDVRGRYRIGTMENPLFPGLFERASTAVGGSILAAELALEGATAFHPSGGTHHGRPDRASGFCYFNDPVFSILTLLETGIDRVLYVDLDAHHGDGVQDAFAADARVFTISIHEKNRWPRSGPVDDRGGGQSRNLPVPRMFNDSELDFLLAHAVLPLGRAFNPQALVITCGADGLDGDPLSKMKLSNVALWAAVERLLGLTRHNVVLGGGGYNPWTVVRCWSGLWGRLSKQELPATLPPEAQAFMGALECGLVDEDEVRPEWIQTLEDPPNPGVVREEIRELAAHVLQ
jgi:acetoin utilization protein AcuC